VYVDDITGAVEVVSSHAQSKGRLLSQRLNPSGYRCVKMNHKQTPIHSLVAELFHGARPDGLVINHIDGDKLNNRPNNLEYCTIAENIKHAIQHGLHVSCDPTKMPTYKDGRTRDKKEYKSNWYQKNRERILAKAKERYHEQKNTTH